MNDPNSRFVRQEGNTVDGDVAGGNIYKYYPEKKTTLRTLAENYKVEVEEDCNQQQFIEELQDYMERVPGHEQRNLEDKLISANRVDLLTDAKLLKEKFAKKLHRHTFSPSAQKLFVHILAKIKCTFKLKINPMINEGQPFKFIDNAIYHEIVESIYSEVGNSQLGIDMDYILGMLYYLTGNCYIEWDKHDYLPPCK